MRSSRAFERRRKHQTSQRKEETSGQRTRNGPASALGFEHKQKTTANYQTFSNYDYNRVEMAQLQFSKSWTVLNELFESPIGQTLQHALASATCGFRFLDLGAAPGGFSAFLLSSAGCAWGIGVTLPPEVGFPMLIDDSLAGQRYNVHYVNLMQLGPRYLAMSALRGEQVDLCLCDGQDMAERHGGNARTSQQCQRGFAEDPAEPWGELQPRVRCLGIWALLLHQIGLALSQLAHWGGLTFRFSWVLSIYDSEVQECDRWYFDATTQLMHMLAEFFQVVDVFKSTQYHTSDSTCYVVCSGFLREHFECHVSACGGVERVFARSALEILRFEKSDDLPMASCLNIIPRPNLQQVVEIQALLEKVTAMREIGRVKKGLSSGNRFANVEQARGGIGRAICRSDGDRVGYPQQPAVSGPTPAPHPPLMSTQVGYPRQPAASGPTPAPTPPLVPTQALQPASTRSPPRWPPPSKPPPPLPSHPSPLPSTGKAVASEPCAAAHRERLPAAEEVAMPRSHARNVGHPQACASAAPSIPSITSPKHSPPSSSAIGETLVVGVTAILSALVLALLWQWLQSFAI